MQCVQGSKCHSCAVLCWPCTCIYIRSCTDAVSCCTLYSIHIISAVHTHINRAQYCEVYSELRITRTTTSSTPVLLSSAGTFLLQIPGLGIIISPHISTHNYAMCDAGLSLHTFAHQHVSLCMGVSYNVLTIFPMYLIAFWLN